MPSKEKEFKATREQIEAWTKGLFKKPTLQPQNPAQKDPSGPTPDTEPPLYYDSEPSSQPPKYTKVAACHHLSETQHLQTSKSRRHNHTHQQQASQRSSPTPP
ncbi:hypothetical protein CC80DRAFT_546390 [Byssothecium circinans]|uniref:Uncharacterized protein n=1 Tax=Byssothecium circinans TaxID=147558 RepID=A0A6A5U1J5_9PLEO|nr:hypothetical protein CC80DRAFT_546390 [Byssothecium circinans]